MAEKTLLYLDMNIFKRSFDDQSFPRIRLEVAAIDTIFANVSADKFEFCWSFILEYENSLNPNLNRRASTILLSQNASSNISGDEKIRNLAKQFEQTNIKSRDALHLACAEVTGCDYFLTCDDKFLKKARQLDITVKAMGPVEFTNIWEHQNGH